MKIVILLLCLLTGCSSQNMEGIKLNKISTAEVYELINDEDVIIIDVREKFEYAEGHLPNSVLIPQGNIEDISDYVDNKDKKIIVYCRSGKRSNAAGQVLVDMGYTNVHDMGGIMSWEYDVVK